MTLQLWPEQEEALRRMEGREYFALFMAMRTGKTLPTLMDFARLEAAGQALDLFILAPAGVYRTWHAALDQLPPSLKNRMGVHLWRSGAGPGDMRRLETFLREPTGPRCLIMNIEALSRVGRAQGTALSFCRYRANKVYCVIDESTVIKNKSERTKFVNRKLQPLTKYRRILSGLPTPKSPLDIYHQAEFLQPGLLGFDNLIAFTQWAAHTEKRDFGGRWLTTIVNKEKGVNGFKPYAIEQIRKMLEPHSYRVEFRPNVPPTYSVREVELTDEQRRVYNELKEFATARLNAEAHVTATVVIAQITRLHQIVMGHVLDENNEEHLLPENRTAALLNELEDYGGKAVIWFAYVGDLERASVVLEKEYGDGSTARFYGNNLATREDDERRFKTEPQCRFMLATAGAGGRGRTWDNADRVIYHSSTDDLEKRDQSEQRAQSRNKVVGVDYVDLICRDTVEEKILHALRNKINMATTINGDNYREWLV